MSTEEEQSDGKLEEKSEQSFIMWIVFILAAGLIAIMSSVFSGCLILFCIGVCIAVGSVFGEDAAIYTGIGFFVVYVLLHLLSGLSEPSIILWGGKESDDS